ncbi:unnamed protein product [Cuscuta campestris]|uniref:Sulfotransferase n=1 Tax=Cuscuta campestris TaxID=132261 RepID=A0A484KZF3_9ASTE|nr:unnamed protein product [Cuscuta campestris]
MAEQICFFTKGTLIIKPPKKSPAIFRVVLVVLAMVCGVFIFSAYLNQSCTDRENNVLNLEVINRHCDHLDIDRSQIPYLHYPKPKTFSRDECACNPVRFFVILTMQRSGSGWFETLLNSHVNVSSNGEIFSFKERRENFSSIVETLDRVYNLDWLTSASKNQCSAAVGFKWMLNQGVMEHPREIVDYLNEKGVSVIFLFRRNLLRRMVSLLANSYDRYAKLLNGTHKSHVHSTEEADTLAKYKPFINTASLMPELNQTDMVAREALHHFNNTRHIILYYEDLVRNKTKTMDALKFLRLPVMNLSSCQVKIHSGPLWKHIKNWDDVRRTLKGTAYEGFLHADY